jgi:anti-anti-sigma regulatory factor
MAQTVVLGSNLDHQATGRLAAEIAAAPGPLDLDGSAVAHVGGLACQLLLRARAATPPDRAVRLVNPSPACVEGLARLGVDALSLA